MKVFSIGVQRAKRAERTQGMVFTDLSMKNGITSIPLGKDTKMAHMKKFTMSAVLPLLKHCDREFIQSSNKDIDHTLTHLNYALLPDRGIKPYKYFTQRINSSDVGYWKRKDTVMMIGWVITLPLTHLDDEIERDFFEKCVDFLNARYGIENAVQAVVHKDESQQGVMINGEIIKGRPHLHYNFIPIISNENTRRNTKLQVCCKKLMNRKELETFHRDLKAYLLEHDVDSFLVSRLSYGAVKSNGRNYSVKEIKSGRMNTRQREVIRCEK